MASAAERGAPDLRAALRETLTALDQADAQLAFRAIRRAAPGGLGEAARHDVRLPAQVSLLEAMVEAAGRDRIARQYATGFADIFETGLPELRALRRRHADPRLTTLGVYLTYLSAFPDTHITRRQGEAVARSVQLRARTVRERFDRAASLEELRDELAAWDLALKSQGTNPGTSADLTVATLFAFELEGILRSIQKSG
jgi:triphosphoribosyl-dephospho-CoA synthase